HRPAVPPRAGRGHLLDFAHDPQNVPRPSGPGPTDLAARPDDAAGERQSALNQQAHGDRGGVPAARRQSGKQRALRLLVIEVEGLRIELTGERLDLRRVDDMGRAGETPSDGEVLEIKAILTPEFMWFRHRDLPVQVTCMMIVTALYCVNAAQELREHA